MISLPREGADGLIPLVHLMLAVVSPRKSYSAAFPLECICYLAGESATVFLDALALAAGSTIEISYS